MAVIKLMPDLDLPPGNYRERKPKGWRWRLPWTHPEDNKLHLVMLVVSVGVLAFIFWHRDELTAGTLFGVAAVFAFVAGLMFTQIFND